MNNTAASALANRLAYANAVAKLESKGNVIVNRKDNTGQRREIRMTQSFLRTEQNLNQNITNYSFGITNNQPNASGTIFPTEQRLTLQDVFFAYKVGFYISMQSTSGANTTYKNQLMTFPNPQFYLSGGIDLNLMQGLWTNGVLNLKINNEVITPAWDLRKHMDVPVNQLNTIGWPNTDQFFNQFDGDNFGMCTIEPNWIFNGGSNIDLEINYAESLTNIGIGSAAVMRLHLIFEGFLAQNASSIMD